MGVAPRSSGGIAAGTSCSPIAGPGGQARHPSSCVGSFRASVPELATRQGGPRCARRSCFSRDASVVALVLLLESAVSGSLIKSAGMATKENCQGGPDMSLPSFQLGSEGRLGKAARGFCSAQTDGKSSSVATKGALLPQLVLSEATATRAEGSATAKKRRQADPSNGSKRCSHDRVTRRCDRQLPSRRGHEINDKR
jgi:hypothetical protein